jgi:hypothetical protein
MQDPIQKIIKAKSTGSVVTVVEHLPSKQKALHTHKKKI